MRERSSVTDSCCCGRSLLWLLVYLCRAELESRFALPDEIQQVIFGQLCNALDPGSAVDYSSASKGLREPMQRVGEGASKSLLQQLKEENEAGARTVSLIRVSAHDARQTTRDTEHTDLARHARARELFCVLIAVHQSVMRPTLYFDS